MIKEISANHIHYDITTKVKACIRYILSDQPIVELNENI